MTRGPSWNIDVGAAGVADAPVVVDATDQDAPAIEALHREAFGGAAEAQLVAALRVAGACVFSRVARVDGWVVGHVVLSPVAIEAGAVGAGEPAEVLGVAPLAVLPAFQRRGIGAALMWGALERSRLRGVAGLVLLGDPAYYRRFGFRPAREFGLRCRWPGTEESFMALELRPGGLASAPGLARYHEAFDALD
jgi:putative acetyltransferase